MAICEVFQGRLPVGEHEICAECREGCDTCGNDGFIMDDETEWDEHEEFRTCPDCRGTPVRYHCCSSREFCEANSLPGRENVERGAIQWFEIKEGGA